MLKTPFYLITLLTVLIFVISCSSEEETLLAGKDFTDTNIRVLSIDTFLVQLSTMKFDSITTSTEERLLIGQYTDADMGVINTASYFQMSPTTYTLNNDAVLDSVGIILGYDTYFYNDTTQVSTLHIHKLTDKLRTDDTYFYNTSSFGYEDTPLVTKTYQPTPNKDSVYVTLPYTFGEELFNGIRDNNITDDESLYQQLKGLTVQPDANDNSAVIGFSTSSEETYLRFFYSMPDELESEEYTYDIAINTYFNHIDSDVSGLPQEFLTDQEDNLYSPNSNNMSYNQAGTGYVTKIEFPSIKNIYDIGADGTILEATLYIELNADSYSDIQPLSEELLLYTLDQNNDFASQVANSIDVVTASLSSEESEFNHVLYNVPVIDFIDQKLSESPETEDALILIPENYNNTVNKIIFNDSEKSNYNTKLIITYALYE
ncbi:DUF4270 domain-containing protein [Lacinutrix sp. C3R15]|uniref:DUF4270 family protein n=1 Tax=Flavobacteriaceae TaxID=49546 RepID=UPI001C09396B|nr:MULTISPECIES: DUF4270 family protein [Flavobacteriaceae]MBU2938502.1 DUF4270 domain-containing protein [Lacinutrix sp. C3R15]MDO6621816.1 DUF4270 family protein [Oceanihabitans sp. 1_MG-2023]